MNTAAVVARKHRSGDQELITRLAGGDEDAFNRALDRYYPSMLHVAVSLVRSRTVAEEIVQDSWLEALAGISRFDARCSFRSWLFRIVVNQVRTRQARERQCVTPPLPSNVGDEPDPTPCEDNRPPRVPPALCAYPGDTVLADELTTCIASAISELPDRQREILVLRDVQGCTAIEVCELLGISDANYRVLLHRARTALRQHLLPYLHKQH